MSRDPLAVVCAVLRDPEGRVLATQRPPDKALPLAWEFPGGKIEPGECPEDALRRELREELEIEVGDLHPLPVVVHQDENHPLKLIPYLAPFSEATPITLNAHLDARWITPKAWQQLNWAPADVPIIAHLLKTPHP